MQQHRMLSPGETALVAVSGGIDSVVLLDLLQRLAPDYGASLHLAHLDHGLRRSSSADARFVERLATERGLPLHASRLDPETLAAYRAQGAEGAARAARYAFLESVAAEVEADRIALGHTADDQVETILHRLARGAGAAGLRGVPPVRPPYIRPLIEATRSEILEYARARKLTWRVDPSNVDPSFARNRIRRRVVPELESINPRAGEAIRRAALLAAEADEANRFLIATLWDAVCSDEGQARLTLRRGTLSTYPHAVQKLLLREGARRVRGDLSGIAHDHIEAGARLVAGGASHGELSLPGLHIRVQSDEILLTRSDETPPQAWAYPVGLGETVIPDPSLTIRLAMTGGRASRTNLEDRWTEHADADRIAFPMVLRSRRDGDRFTPLGLGKSIKLKNLLINERVPYYDRDRVPLLCDREKIVWVVGVRLSNEVRITDTTQRVLMMKARERA